MVSATITAAFAEVCHRMSNIATISACNWKRRYLWLIFGNSLHMIVFAFFHFLFCQRIHGLMLIKLGLCSEMFKVLPVFWARSSWLYFVLYSSSKSHGVKKKKKALCCYCAVLVQRKLLFKLCLKPWPLCCFRASPAQGHGILSFTAAVVCANCQESPGESLLPPASNNFTQPWKVYLYLLWDLAMQGEQLKKAG